MTNFYFFRNLLLFCAFLIGTLSFTACSSGSDSSPDVILEFFPYNTGPNDAGVNVYWNNSASFESLNITSINITAISYDADGEVQDHQTRILTTDAEIEALSQRGTNGFDFDGLVAGNNYIFEFHITVGDDSPTKHNVGFAVEENQEDYEETEENLRGIEIGAPSSDNPYQTDEVVMRLEEPEPEPDPTVTDTDTDGVDDDDDLCLNSVNPTFVSTGANDQDGDGCEDAVEDVDNDGDGLIEIFVDVGNSITIEAEASLFHISYQLDGTALTNSTDTTSDGCGGQDGISSCNGYELMENISIDLSGSALPLPLGKSDGSDTSCPSDSAFTAILEGNDNTITLRDSWGAATDDCVGLFARLKGAEIRNLAIITMEGGRSSYRGITGTNNVGVLAGWAEESTITNVHASSTLLQGVRAVGGLVGLIEGAPGGDPSIIKDSSAKSSKIVACASAGGLVGNSNEASIQNSFAINKQIELPFNATAESELFVEVSLNCDSIRTLGITHHIYENLGGLIGVASSSSVISSYAINGDLIGNWKIGGLAGDLGGEVRNSFAVTRNIQAKLRTAGGLLGQADDNSDILASYAITKQIDATGVSSSYPDEDANRADGEAGGLVGRAKVVTVNNSYAISESIIGGDDVSDQRQDNGTAAGLLGSSNEYRLMSSDIDITVTNSYAAFDSISGHSIRPLVGRNNLTGVEIMDSYWDTNATSNTVHTSDDSLSDLQDFSQNTTGGSPYAKVQGSLRTGEEIINPLEHPDDVAFNKSSDIFENWRNADCSKSGEDLWDFGTNTEYPAISCTPDPDELIDQREWYYFTTIPAPDSEAAWRNTVLQIIQVNETRIDQKIDEELNQ